MPFTMPWTKKDYPPSMKNLPAAVRNKAVEIANALIADTDMEEGIAIATATSRAKDWAANRGMPTESKAAQATKTDVKIHGEDRHVIPGDKGWSVKKEKSARTKHFDTKREAILVAKKAAKKANASVTVKGHDGRIESRESFNSNRKKTKY